jgi:hypothetical protein
MGDCILSRLLVGYDLNSPRKDYTDLIEKMKSYGAWWHHLDSTWLIKTTKTPTEVRDELRSCRTPTMRSSSLMSPVTLAPGRGSRLLVRLGSGHLLAITPEPSIELQRPTVIGEEIIERLCTETHQDGSLR